MADRFEAMSLKKAAKRAAGTVLLSASLMIAVATCGEEPAQKAPITQVDAGKDATVKPDASRDGGGIDGFDVEVPDTELKDGGAGPDMDEKDVGDPCADSGGQDIGSGDAGKDGSTVPDAQEKDSGPDATGGDIESSDGSQDVGDGGSPDACDGQTETQPFTRTETDPLPGILGAIEGQVTYTYEGQQEVICGQVQSEDVSTLTVSFNPPRQDDGNNMVAREAREIKMLNVTVEVQMVMVEDNVTKLILVSNEGDCTLNGPCSQFVPTMCNGRSVSCVGIIDEETVRMFYFDGVVGINENVMKEGNYRCRGPPNEGAAYRCGKIHIVDPQADNGKGQVKLIISGARAIEVANGEQLRTRAMFPGQEKTPDPKPVYVNFKTWATTALDVTVGEQDGKPLYMINGFTIIREANQ